MTAEASECLAVSNEPILDKLRRLRDEAAAEIERLIAFIDAVDGDGDMEPSLAAVERGEGSQALWSDGGNADLEEDILDQPHDEIAREI